MEYQGENYHNHYVTITTVWPTTSAYSGIYHRELTMEGRYETHR